MRFFSDDTFWGNISCFHKLKFSVFFNLIQILGFIYINIIFLMSSKNILPLSFVNIVTEGQQYAIIRNFVVFKLGFLIQPNWPLQALDRIWPACQHTKEPTFLSGVAKSENKLLYILPDTTKYKEGNFEESSKRSIINDVIV